MNSNNQFKLIELLKTKRNDTLKALYNILKDAGVKIKVPQNVLNALFIRKTSKKYNSYGVDSSRFITDDPTMQLYQFFDFGDFEYNNLELDFSNDGSTFELMRKYGITLYTDNILNKNGSHQVFKDIRVVGNFDDWNIRYADFTGVIGEPIIYPNKLLDKSMTGAILRGAFLDGDCDGVDIAGVNFTGCYTDNYFSIDPSKVLGKNLSNVKLDGITIDGSFDGVKIIYTDFRGATVIPKINIDKLSLPNNEKTRKLTGNKFMGVTFDGVLNNCILIDNDFTGSKGAVLDFIKEPGLQVYSKNNNFQDVTLRNIHYACSYFLTTNHNKFDNSILEYNVHNRDLSLDRIKECSSNIILINKDAQLEEDIQNIINPEIQAAKKLIKEKK